MGGNFFGGRRSLYTWMTLSLKVILGLDKIK